MLTLVLSFKLQNGKSFRLSIPDPKQDLTPQEVDNLMQLIIQRNIFDTPSPIVERISARLIDRNVNTLIG